MKKMIPAFFENILNNVNQLAIEVVIADFDRNVSYGSPDKVVSDRLV